MPDDELDPRPRPDLFALRLAERAAERDHDPEALARWLRGWHDREGAWTNLRNIEHWLQRAGA